MKRRMLLPALIATLGVGLATLAKNVPLKSCSGKTVRAPSAPRLKLAGGPEA